MPAPRKIVLAQPAAKSLVASLRLTLGSSWRCRSEPIALPSLPYAARHRNHPTDKPAEVRLLICRPAAADITHPSGPFRDVLFVSSTGRAASSTSMISTCPPPSSPFTTYKVTAALDAKVEIAGNHPGGRTLLVAAGRPTSRRTLSLIDHIFQLLSCRHPPLLSKLRFRLQPPARRRDQAEILSARRNTLRPNLGGRSRPSRPSAL